MARASNFIVVGDFTIDPENRDALIEALVVNRRQTLATEVGCRTYEVCIREDGDASHVYMVEIYDDRAAFESHLKTAHFKVWNDTAAHLIKDIKATFLHRMLADPVA